MLEAIHIDHLEPHILSKDIALQNFDCGDSDLNEFLLEDSFKYQEQGLAQTTCIFYKGGLVAFYSLASDALSAQRLTGSAKKRDVHHAKRYIENFPAIKLARMAVSEQYCGRKIGQAIISIVKGFAYSLHKQGVAVKYITVDAYKDRTGFYEKHGFVNNLESDEEKADPKRHTISMRHHLFG